MSRHVCWNCDYRLDGDPSRCPRCGMPLAGLDAPREPAAAAAATGAGPAKVRSRRKTAAKSAGRPEPTVEIIPPVVPSRSAAARIAAGAGKGLRFAATGAGRGLLASLGIARKSVATGAALSVRTARLVGSAAGGVASGVRSGGTKLVAYRPQRATRVLDGDILQRENVRTISDVAERLLREARDENARLAARIAALEARFAADRGIAEKPSSTSRERAAAAPAKTTATARKARSAVARPAAARTERSQRREPDAVARPLITLEATAEPAMAANGHAEAPASPARPATRRRSARTG